jgi:hypothetical protein
MIFIIYYFINFGYSLSMPSPREGFCGPLLHVLHAAALGMFETPRT